MCVAQAKNDGGWTEDGRAEAQRVGQGRWSHSLAVAGPVLAAAKGVRGQRPRMGVVGSPTLVQVLHLSTVVGLSLQHLRSAIFGPSATFFGGSISGRRSTVLHSVALMCLVPSAIWAQIERWRPPSQAFVASACRSVVSWLRLGRRRQSERPAARARFQRRRSNAPPSHRPLALRKRASPPTRRPSTTSATRRLVTTIRVARGTRSVWCAARVRNPSHGPPPKARAVAPSNALWEICAAVATRSSA